MSEQTNSYIIPADINALSFDSFGRDPRRDVVCLSPIRTIIHREEEITLQAVGAFHQQILQQLEKLGC
ncbi:hypothetical protein [Leptolyngbya sp. 7M]|uniref:hypothetical protein n=1 Tax=Leptolyngbya sp. 7M TaxID=2812896 RepID=UPI001B8BC82D|nr:hypothetical protein [Leptolyngbya sp. 7M]QYO63888.1 hypothetical protein JVX88_29415 [Leptolyngbya sp. 7M]